MFRRVKVNHPRGFVFAATIVLFATGLLFRAQPQDLPRPNQDTLTVKLSSEIKPLPVLNAMQRVADGQLAHPSAHKPTEWTQGAGDAGLMALVGISGDAKYRDAALAMAETNNWQLGLRKYMADDHCVGQMYAELYLLYRDPKMITPLRERFDAILANPPNLASLDFTQPGRGQDLWSWCDSLFMGPPTWLRLYAATDDKRYLDFAVSNWWRTTDYLYDKDEHLYFRDSTYFKKTEANGKKIFWGRGNGWVMGGIVRTLQYLPMNHPDRPRFEQLFKDMADKILTCQQPDGLWRASLLDPDSYPLKETSGSGFYTYALAWGVNQELLDRAKFEPAVRKAWAALTDCVDADGKLTHVQPIGADPKKFADDSTEVYGVGAFLLAGSEVYRMAVLEIPKIPNNEITAISDSKVPAVMFEDVPVTSIIYALAQEAKIKFNLDSKIGYNQADKNGVIKPEPVVMVHWSDLSYIQALQMVVDNCGLQITQDTDDKIYHITVASNLNPSPFISSPTIVKITNPVKFRRDCETAEFDLDQTRGYNLTNLYVMDGLSSRILDSQIYSSGHGTLKGRPDKLLFQVDLAPGETRTFYILDASALAAVPPPIVKTFARYVPERHDDFAWESDRIAHRLFGKALETWQEEPLTSSGYDVWIKRTRSLVANEMYHTGQNYDTNWVMQDDYKVGKTRGDGGIGIWDGQKLYVSSNWRNWKLITTGPVRSEFELTYDAWDANGRKVSETKRISIDAGSNMSRVESIFGSDDKSPLQIGIGLAERPGENVIVPDGSSEVDSWQTSTDKGLVVQNQSEGWMAYWQPQDFTKGTTAVAFVLPKGSVQAFTNDISNLPAARLAPPTHTVTEGQPALRDLLAVTQAEAGKPFVYYVGAGWDRSGDFPNAKSWTDYVRHFAERRDQPLQVTVGN
jgi:rhamnogalacturonyl hydrolase YesR